MRRMFFLLFFFICVSMLHAAPKREMRGVWIATVANIDWPSKKGDVQSQKSEMVKMLDSLQSCHINTVVFQIRPCADAFYKSVAQTDLNKTSKTFSALGVTNPTDVHEVDNLMLQVFEKISKNSKPLDPEFAKILSDNMLDLF